MREQEQEQGNDQEQELWREQRQQSGEAMRDAGAEGRDSYDMDIDRMVNEGLGGGNVTLHNGLIAESTTDTMEPDVLDAEVGEGE